MRPDQLGVTQSALSQTMKRLEHQLGFRLLARSRKIAQLTGHE